MKDYLKKLIQRKKAEQLEIQQRSDASEDIKEVRALGETLKKLGDEIREAEEKLAELEGEGGGEGDEGAQRSEVPANAVLRNGQVVGSFAMRGNKQDKKDPYDTEEYRTAFMNYVCRNVPIPKEVRADEVTMTTDAGAVIPTNIMNEIIKELKTFGNFYKLIRKLNVQGGVAIPVLSLKPEATWIGEGASESKKLTANDNIIFNYYGVECKIAQTLLANVVTLATFQELFVPLAAEAIVKAVEIACFNGDGNKKPLGILKDTRIPEENVITLTPEEFNSWGGWHKKVKAKMKKAYRNGTFFMAQGTFDGYIDGMEDKNGQPVGRTNYGINSEETYRFMGKAVETVEDECIACYEDAAEGDVVAIFMKPTDYAINSNMQMTAVKWVDNDTNEIKNKCIMIIDGKLVDPYGVLIIKKGASIEA